MLWTGSCLHCVVWPEIQKERGFRAHVRECLVLRSAPLSLNHLCKMLQDFAFLSYFTTFNWFTPRFCLTPLLPASSPPSTPCFIILHVSKFWGRLDLRRVLVALSVSELWVRAFEGCSHFSCGCRWKQDTESVWHIVRYLKYLFLLPNVGALVDIRICQVIPVGKYFEEFPILSKLSLLLRVAVPEQGLHDYSHSFAWADTV